jgi:GTP pyrophosphokinase
VTSTVPMLAPELARAVAAQRERLDLDLLARAYRVSAQAHHGQKRVSGDDFLSHSVAVATLLAELQMDSTTIAAALLPDVVEDSDVSLDQIRHDFGPEVAGLVDGLTNVSSLTFRSSAEEQAENYRKLLLSVAKDARVIIIKLADRLHNMRTLEHLDAERQRRIALETREIYAPLAHRFGMAGVKAELEDLAFKFLEPEDYRVLSRQVRAKKAARERTIERLRAPLVEELAGAGLSGFEATGRRRTSGRSIRDEAARQALRDLTSWPCVVNSTQECYTCSA